MEHRRKYGIHATSETERTIRLENELLKARIQELEAELAKFRNAHTQPSPKRGRNRKKDHDKNIKRNLVKR